MSWSHGANGLTIFNANSEGKVNIGLIKANAWSPEIDIKTLTSSKGPFEILEPSTRKAYQLAYCVQTMSGEYCRSQMVSMCVAI